MSTDIPNRLGTIAVRRSVPTDMPGVVHVHQVAFMNFFLTSLGPAFLSEFYTGILADPSGMAYVAAGDEQIVGFVAGSSQPAGFYTRLLRQRWWRFGLASIKPILRNPRIVPRLLRAFAMPGQARASGNAGTLMSIAVLPDQQGQGVGQALVRAFLSEAVQRGLARVNLTTDGVANDAANLFYRRLGFTCVCQFVTPEGRPMNEYEIVLSSIDVQELA